MRLGVAADIRGNEVALRAVLDDAAGCHVERWRALGAKSTEKFWNCAGERRAEVYRVDISADLNDDDGSGFIWAFLDEARDPALVRVGALLVAGDEDGAAMCQVTGVEPAADGGTIVHLGVLPGLVEDYLGAAGRAVVG